MASRNIFAATPPSTKRKTPDYTHGKSLPTVAYASSAIVSQLLERSVGRFFRCSQNVRLPLSWDVVGNSMGSVRAVLESSSCCCISASSVITGSAVPENRVQRVLLQRMVRCCYWAPWLVARSVFGCCVRAYSV